MTVYGAEIIDSIVIVFPTGLVIHRSALEVGCKAAGNITGHAAAIHIRNSTVCVAGNQVADGIDKTVGFDQGFHGVIIANLRQTACFGNRHKACRIAAVISRCYGFQVGDMGVFYLGAVAAGHKAGSCIIPDRVFLTNAGGLYRKAIANAFHIGVCDSNLHRLPQREQIVEFQKIIQAQQVHRQTSVRASQLTGAGQADKTAYHVFTIDGGEPVNGDIFDRAANGFTETTTDALDPAYSKAICCAVQCYAVYSKCKIRGNAESRVQ